MKFLIETSEGRPIESDITEALSDKVASRIRIVSTRAQVREAIRSALDELESEVREQTTHLGPEHR